MKTLISIMFSLLSSMAFACSVPADLAAMKQATLDRVNDQRADNGLPALRDNPALDQAAQAHACDNAGTGVMTHDGSDGSDLGQRLDRAGYDYARAAENVAMGFTDPAAVVLGWMGSAGHRRNILRDELRDAGLGIALSDEGDVYWVLNLGRRAD
jgi:uncharacterized protein YkwD